MTSRFLDYSLPTFERDLSPYAPAVGNQFWSQNSFNVEGVAEKGDLLGWSLAAGDFNGDGRDDLAIGVYGEDVGTIKDAGAVNILYGSKKGLTATSDQLWHQNSPSVEGSAEIYDHFGATLGAGDFNGDGRDDLAIGVYGEDVGTIKDAGAVNILYGSKKGLTATGDQLWHQNSSNVEGAAETGDWFGNSLAAGDFNGDGRGDLAVGVVGESIGTVINAGAVNILYGSSSGLTATGDQLWHQNSSNVEGAAETGDWFGDSLAAGDFNGDGRDDLAIGVYGEDVGTIKDAGAVNILYGSKKGLTATSDQLWHQNSLNVEGSAIQDDYFGSALGVGDFNGDGRDDLAIGVPGEDVNAVIDAGAVNVLYGSSSGLTAINDQLWHQNSPNVGGVVGAYDGFGGSISVGDFNNDGFADLAIGVSGDTVGLLSGAGAVQILYGSSSGLTA